MTNSNHSFELRRNYDAFLKILPTIMPSHKGQYALLRHGQIVGYHDRLPDAILSGRRQFPDQLFSVQEVTDRKADFGWYSRAEPRQPIR